MSGAADTGRRFKDKLGRDWVSVSMTQSPKFAQACLDVWRERCRADTRFPEAPRHLTTVRQWRFAGVSSIEMPEAVLEPARKRLAAQVAAAREAEE